MSYIHFNTYKNLSSEELLREVTNLVYAQSIAPNPRAISDRELHLSEMCLELKSRILELEDQLFSNGIPLVEYPHHE